MFTVHVDTRGLVPWRAEVDAAARRAAQMSGSSAIRAMRAEGARRIRERKAMKVGAIGKALTIIYPTSKEQMIWKVRAKAAVMPVSAFPHRQVGKARRDRGTGRFKKGTRVEGGRGGVWVEINKGRRVLMRGAFIAQMKSGHKGVFRRLRGGKRLPIREAFTTQVSDAFGDAIPFVSDRGRSVFAATYARVFPLEVAKRKGRP